jgi:hypothetical protein
VRARSGRVDAHVDLSCAPPASVFNVSAQQYTPAFKAQRSVQLDWPQPCPVRDRVLVVI